MRRSSALILREILEMSPSTWTGIRFGVGMNHTQAQRYLPFLVENGHLGPRLDRTGNTVYQITAKGKTFLRLLSELHDIVDVTQEIN